MTIADRLPSARTPDFAGRRFPVRSAVAVGAALAGVLLVLTGCGGEPESGSSGQAGAQSVSEAGWETDFSTSSVPLDEIRSGGPPKDGIPAIDNPKVVSANEADSFLSPDDPVALLRVGDSARAYPLQILIWHEIVNDRLGGTPVAVTFCPLCNSTVVYDRRFEDRVLDFGTTGNLRNSDLVMYDRQTESWWQQLTGEAIVGELTGSELEPLPSQILSWSDLKDIAPEADVLSRDTGFNKDYGSNPYVGYERPNEKPFLLDGRPDDRLPPKERVAAVKTGSGSAVVYPFSLLADDPVVNDRIDDRPVAVFYDPDLASALDQAGVSTGKQVGTAAVFDRRLNGQTLHFLHGGAPGRFTDRETGSTWDMGGRAIDGDLSGEKLSPVTADDQFWFALAAFFPDAKIRG